MWIEQFFIWTHKICKSVPSDTDNLVIFKVLNPVKCLIGFIQFMNNINSAIYREVVLSQVYQIKVSEGTACVTWNEEYVIRIQIWILINFEPGLETFWFRLWFRHSVRDKPWVQIWMKIRICTLLVAWLDFRLKSIFFFVWNLQPHSVVMLWI